LHFLSFERSKGQGAGGKRNDKKGARGKEQGARGMIGKGQGARSKRIVLAARRQYLLAPDPLIAS